MERIFTHADLDERLVRAEHLKDVKNLTETIAVVYANTDTVFIYDSTSLSDEEKDMLVKCLISRVQTGTNYSREIIAKSGNVYFVY
jgi:hypothetical protein